jgi:hypothetical protein
MKGFVKNESRDAFFVLQRPVPPGGKISLEDAYSVVGERSGKKQEAAFVRWLRDNYFKGSGWAFYREEGVPFFSEEEPVSEVKEAVVPARGAGKVMRRQSRGSKGAEVTPKTIVEAPYDRAKVLIDKCTDRAVLRKALALTRHFSKKEEHMRYLMRRLEQVY